MSEITKPILLDETGKQTNQQLADIKSTNQQIANAINNLAAQDRNIWDNAQKAGDDADAAILILEGQKHG